MLCKCICVFNIYSVGQMSVWSVFARCSVGQKTVLPKQNCLLTNKHRWNCWSDDCWSRDGTPVMVMMEKCVKEWEWCSPQECNFPPPCCPLSNSPRSKVCSWKKFNQGQVPEFFSIKNNFPNKCLFLIDNKFPKQTFNQEQHENIYPFKISVSL